MHDCLQKQHWAVRRFWRIGYSLKCWSRDTERPKNNKDAALKLAFFWASQNKSNSLYYHNLIHHVQKNYFCHTCVWEVSRARASQLNCRKTVTWVLYGPKNAEAWGRLKTFLACNYHLNDLGDILEHGIQFSTPDYSTNTAMCSYNIVRLAMDI